MNDLLDQQKLLCNPEEVEQSAGRTVLCTHELRSFVCDSTPQSQEGTCLALSFAGHFAAK